ncbi:lysophospholipid acyltransferase family protein [Pedobacter sp. SD-b]|uniref:Lysophospholipid acyltransferase family protein n=1 Tax=Pedobacter segetis TaxID=2793069 RepID=A0ABS1BI84_9SPHI|nr:lysophospholipid acyltransferase family protein [Pedobacter segetis]MBK0382574.1 lysophospholipid acyltransferase family protein [Pedobacter segetis]
MINRGLFYVAAFFLYLLSLLPMFLLYLLSDFIYLVLFYVIKYRRHVVLSNLQNSFPDKSLEELKAIEKKFFKYLADLFVETIKMISAPPSFIEKRFSFSNIELLRKYEEKSQSYLSAVGHYGNWEWSAIVTPIAMKAAVLIIYKPLNNAFFDDFFKKAREKSGAKMIRMKTSLKEIIRRKNDLTSTIFATDQTPAHGDSQAWVTFLNQETAVFMGLEKIAKSTNSPIIFCDVALAKRGYYTCDFKLVCDDPSKTDTLEITKKHTKILEDRINAEPAYWLWSHKRWKYKKEVANGTT